MDAEQFEDLYLTSRGQIFAYAAARVSPQEALDIAHETFEIAWRKRDEAPSRPEDLAPWCFGIARNVVLRETQRRQRKHHDNRFREDYGPETEWVSEHDVAALIAEAHQGRSIWRALSIAERELVVIALGTEATGAEVATLLGTSYSAYTTRLSRLRHKLSRLLTAPAESTEMVTPGD